MELAHVLFNHDDLHHWLVLIVDDHAQVLRYPLRVGQKVTGRGRRGTHN